jgi:signal transduction histidine kinase/CheY-like chemotaxis protein
MHELARQIEKLKKINTSLMARLERTHDGEPNAFSLFENAAAVDRQVRHQTEDLRQALRVLKRSNDALNQAKQIAEAANALKTTFLASVSHDLLQPLHATRLTLSVLNDKTNASADLELLGQADRSLAMLEDIIKTLLDLSKLDAGVSKPDIRGVAIAGLIDELFAEFAPAAANRGLILRRRGSKSNVYNVYTDPLLLRRILQNLLSNAIRYTRKGGVLLCCKEQGGFLRIDIADTGPGIKHERRAAIFKEFQRDDHGIGKEPGFGLGLAIVRRLALAMGHQIKLWSRLGFGSVFSILMPRAQDGELFVPENERPLSSPFEGVQILIVTAHESLFETIVNQLASWGCEVATVVSSDAARIHMRSAERTPDLLIAGCDQGKIEAPAEMIHSLRVEAESFIPAFLISPESESQTQVQGSGLEVLHLPIKPAELRALIAHLLMPPI